MSRVVLVSNRVAVSRKSSPAGGVSVALSLIAQERETLWFGWSGEIAEESGERIERRGRTVTVPLSSAEYSGYYLGYANSVLWPVFHNRLDLAQFEAGFYQTYSEVNRRLAALLCPLLRPDDLIWVHDYHLMPLARELKLLGVNCPIGFFLHIPFPPWQTCMAIPEHRQLAQALSAYDLIGLQTRADVANMIDYFSNGVLGRIVPDGRVRLFDRLVAVASFPVGIDIDEFASSSQAMGPPQRGSGIRIVGVDRLDYTKGLPQKFRAFGRFLEKYPHYRNQVVLTQIAPPTRESVEAYSDIRHELETLAGSINGRYGELDWVPINYIRRATSRRKLARLLRDSSVAMVTPLRDGMNLIAKEYIAAQDPADPGVLILSQFAGAAENLDQALIANPYNIDGVADLIHTGVTMGLEERQLRHAQLLAAVRENDAAAWSRSFLRALERAKSAELPEDWPNPIRAALAKFPQRGRKREASVKGGAKSRGVSQAFASEAVSK
jgi:trehalose 6-phosphate synthase